MYLDFGEMDQQFINPAGEYMIDATYTWSKFSIYGAYIALTLLMIGPIILKETIWVLLVLQSHWVIFG